MAGLVDYDFEVISMQVVYKDEVERVSSRGTNLMDIIICPRWIGRYLEREHYGGVGNRRN